MDFSAFSPAEKRLLVALNDCGVKFVVVGLASAVLQGAHVATQDIDLWIENLSDSAFRNAVSMAGAIYIPPGPMGQNPPMLGPEEFQFCDLVTHMHGLGDFSTEYQNSLLLVVDEIPLRVLPLEAIIRSKEATNREKDRAVLPVLKAALKVIQNP